MFTVRLTTDKDEKSWDNFVFNHKEASFFHKFIWGKILEDGGAGKRLYFVAEAKNGIAGIFPSFLVYKPIINLRCLPVSDYGSPLVSYTNDASEILSYLLKSVELKATKNLCAYLSLRVPSFSSLLRIVPKKYERELTSYGIRLDIRNKDIDVIWQKMLSKKRRNSIRKAIKANLEIRLDSTIRDISSYYELHAQTMRAKKVSPLSFRLFKSLHNNLRHQEDYILMLAKYGDEYIAGILAFLFRDGIYLWGNSSRKKFLHLNPNDLLYWRLIEYAFEKGFNFVDFGPSRLRKEANHLFKIQFGGEPFEIYDYYYSPFPCLLKLRKLFVNVVKR